jgi:hypothetical protein
MPLAYCDSGGVLLLRRGFPIDLLKSLLNVVGVQAA